MTRRDRLRKLLKACTEDAVSDLLYYGPTMVLLKEEDLKALVDAMEEAEELLGEYCQHWEGAPAPSEIRTKNLHGKLCELLRTTPAKK